MGKKIMKKKSVKNIFMSLILVASLMVTSSALGSKAFAAEDSSLFVSTGDGLVLAVEKADDGSTIFFNNDIVLSKTVKIRKSLTIDLQGHTLTTGVYGSLQCGGRDIDHYEDYTVYHPGEWYDEVTKIHHEGYWYYAPDGTQKYQPSWDDKATTRKWKEPWTEIKKRAVYTDGDAVEINIKNGTIVHSDGKDGENAKDNVETFTIFAKGEDGQEPFGAPIKIVSGNSFFSNVNIYAGNGGNGGNGAYTKISGFWRTGGHGGDGGNGGNGGDIFYITGGRVCISSDCQLFPGNGGKGGKGSAGNPNYWMVSSKAGKDGSDGKSGKISNDDRSIYYI